MHPQASAKPFIPPDILVDRFMGNAQLSPDFEGTADLLRAPFSSEQGPDPLEISLGEVGIPPGKAAPGSRATFGLARSIGPVGSVTAIAPKLPIDGASVPPEPPGNPGDAQPLQTEFSRAYSVLQGELLVNSHRCSLFGRKEKRLFWQLALLNSESVALGS